VKIYLAGSSKEWKKCRLMMVALRAAGHDITYDWTVDVEEYGEGNVVSGDVAIEIVDNDISGVNRAQVVVVVSSGLSIGKWIELGYAMAKNKKIIFVGEPNTIFKYHYTIAATAYTIRDVIRLLK
jgi:nucleoside 2-deoxyribosyltransferase